MKHSLCPKTDKIDDYLTIMNNFQNETERKSISLNVFLCDPRYDKTCDSLENTEFILNNIYWQQQVL
jgi:hypothetical protein